MATPGARDGEKAAKAAAAGIILVGLFGPLFGSLSSPAFAVPHRASPPPAGSQADLLPDLLARTSAYCEKIKSLALFYVCDEKIESVRFVYKQRRIDAGPVEGADRAFAKTWRTKFEPRGSKKRTYLYDYQLINEAGKLTERRTLLEENRKKMNQEVPALKDIRFSGQYLVFGPVGFLSKSWQSHFRYEVVGRETADGKEAVVVRCEPKVRGGDNDNAGRVWLDAGDASILRIEWEPSSIQGYDEQAPEGYRKRVMWTVDYGTEKNGVRFPSRQIVSEFLLDEKDLKIPLEQVTFDYLDYKFFKVGVEIKYRP